MFRFVNSIVPKRKGKICIHSFPDYDDMTRALLEGLAELPGQFQITILTHGKNKPPQWACYSNVVHLKKFTAKGIWTYLRSKYVFFTVGCFSSKRPVKSQVSVNVWHGMPIKKIAKYLGENSITPYSTYGVSTSPFFTDIISHAFALPKERVLEVGLPRNDILINKQNKSLKEKLCGTEKMAIWLPTYRKSVKGEIRMDGVIEENAFNLPDIDLPKLNAALKNLGIVAILKQHPLAFKNIAPISSGLSNIRVVDNEYIAEQGASLYELINSSDFLITDVSSVLVDYLLLDRPIICHFPDEKEYRNSRGLVWDFKPADYGIPVVITQDELIRELKNAEENGAGKQGYPELKKMMHSQTTGFSKSLFKKLGLC